MNTDRLNPVLESLSGRLKIISLLAPLVLAINCIGLILCAYVLFSVSNSLNQRSGLDLMEQIRADFAEFQVIDRATRKSTMNVRGLEEKLDMELSERGLLDITSTVIASERNAQLFLRLLKVNMYNLAGQIPGTASWYEIYAPVIDAALERSRSRQLQLLQIQRHYETAA